MMQDSEFVACVVDPSAVVRVIPHARLRVFLATSDLARGYVVAGGAALALIDDFEPSDVDLFYVDAEPLSPHRADQLLTELCRVLHPCRMTHTSFAHTVRHESGFTVQVIRRASASLEQLFASFDLPCCEFAYSLRDGGGSMYTSERGLAALQTRVIVGPTVSKHRADKYSARGYNLVEPLILNMKGDENYHALDCALDALHVD